MHGMLVLFLCQRSSPALTCSDGRCTLCRKAKLEEALQAKAALEASVSAQQERNSKLQAQIQLLENKVCQRPACLLLKASVQTLSQAN